MAAEPLSTDERAELEILRDVAQRLIGFDGGAEVMDWATRHKLHADEPYIGCPFCRHEFVTASELRDIAEQALDVLERERRATGVDEWDESDPRALLYSAAYDILGEDGYTDVMRRV